VIYIYDKTSLSNISSYRLILGGGITDMSMFASAVQPPAISKYTLVTVVYRVSIK